ncbi:flagellar hook-associated protein [Aneurinibacillus soli]|uniref:Flagellar hook-associated protein 2 n=1 Tax=Aneurinibacillus soli TaxID=1500254 RepID=A0A0U5B4H4_9BACL|nr:flagellar filament capping protein FliD [Aneurinibacillus soli]PYE61479.1 flagellar hook-associated protein [Aneurinibacillus soli]BAU26566.1 flagellar capping protein [Aneurinibacillus soli]
MASFTSLTRISGLNSGMDTESLVKKLMDAESIRYNKMKQDQQKLTWQSDAYRQWNTDLFSFRSTVSDMKFSRNYNTFSTTSSNPDAVVATAGPDAIDGIHTIKVSQLAASATVKATGVKFDVTKSLGDTSQGSPLAANDKLTISTTDGQGVSHTAQIDIKTTDKIGDVVNALNAAKDTDGKSLGIQAMYDSNLQQFIIKTKSTGAKTSINITGNDATLSTFGLQNSSRYASLQDTNATNATLKLNIDSTSFSADMLAISTKDSQGKVSTAQIKIEANYTVNDVLNAFNSAKDSNGNALGIQATYDSGSKQLTIKTNEVGAQTSLSITGTKDVSGTTLDALGLKDASDMQSINGIDPKMTVPVPKIVSGTPLNLADKLTITATDSKGMLHTAKIDIKATDTIEDIMTTLSSAKDSAGNSLGIQATYDGASKQLVITGGNTKLGITGSNASLVALGLKDPASPVSTISTTGVDSVITSDGSTVTQSSNSVTLFGVNYTLKQADDTKDITVNVARDYDAAVKNIKDFIGKYNDMLDKVYKAMSESVDKNYQPLTDDQRQAMNQDQIKQWEDRAKSGLLHNDTILSTLYNKLRSDTFSTVDNGSVYNSLAAVGIKSNGYLDRGKLTVDETKLREALQNDPEAVRTLFTQSKNAWKSANQVDDTARGLNSVKFSVGSASYTVTLDPNDTTSKVAEKINDYAKSKNISVQASYDSGTKLFSISSSLGQDFQFTDGASVLGNLQDVSGGQKGIVNRMYDSFYSAFQSTIQKAGLSTSDKADQSVVGKLLKDINKRISDEKTRLTNVENSYYSKFTAMEKALSQYNSQSSALMQQLGLGGK